MKHLGRYLESLGAAVFGVSVAGGRESALSFGDGSPYDAPFRARTSGRCLKGAVTMAAELTFGGYLFAQRDASTSRI